jgi:hypothetical protein
LLHGLSNGSHRPSLNERIAHLTKKPLNAFLKVLLIFVFLLPFAASIFIGLFAGATYNLRDHDEGSPNLPGIISITTATATANITTGATSGAATVTETIIPTATATTTATSVRTKTIEVPTTGATGLPREVRHESEKTM